MCILTHRAHTQILQSTCYAFGKLAVCDSIVQSPCPCTFSPFVDVCCNPGTKPTPTRGHSTCRSPSFTGKLPRVAFCMGGHARALYKPKNYLSMKYNLLDAFGADTKLFGYLKVSAKVLPCVCTSIVCFGWSLST